MRLPTLAALIVIVPPLLAQTTVQMSLGSLAIEDVVLRDGVMKGGVRGIEVVSRVALGGRVSRDLRLRYRIVRPDGRTVRRDVIENVTAGRAMRIVRVVRHFPHSELARERGSDLVVSVTVDAGPFSARGDAELRPGAARALRLTHIDHLRRETVEAPPPSAGVSTDDAARIRAHEDVLTGVTLRGLGSETLYVGAYLRDLDGELVRCSRSAPPANRGRGQRVQIQQQVAAPSGDTERWIAKPLVLPLDWAALDQDRDHVVVVTCYACCGGLWSLRSREIVLTNPSVHAALPGVVIVGDPRIDVEARIRRGEISKEQALFDAIERGEASVVEYLLRSGADVRAVDPRGQSPLHLAAARGRTSAAKRLIDHDRARGAVESAGEVAPLDFDSHLLRTCPTLDMVDGGGRTPLHVAAAAGRQGLAETLVASGAGLDVRDGGGRTPVELARTAGHPRLAKLLTDRQDVAAVPTPVPAEREAESRDEETPPRGDPTKVSAHVLPLRRSLRRIEKAATAVAAMKYGPKPETAALKRAATELGRAADELLAYVESTYRPDIDSGSRFGTYEELRLWEKIRATHEEACEGLMALAGIEDLNLAEGETEERRRSRAARLLEDAAQGMAEQAAVRWADENGLGHLLVVEHRNKLTGKVRKELDLDLERIADRQCREMLGMPLGGLRSFRAAFRLQARRHIRDYVRQCVLEITSSNLVVRFAQRLVVNWAENELWPKIREGLRPKRKLDRRVDISVDSLMEARDELSRTGARTRDVDYLLVMRSVTRARGALAATRYLDKDLARAGREDLQDQMAAAKRILERDLTRFLHQFGMGDMERWDTIEDEHDYLVGNQEGLEKLIARLDVPEGGVALVVKFPYKPLSEYTGKTLASFPFFIIGLEELPAATAPKTVVASCNGKNYVLWGETRKGKRQYAGFVPVLPGPCRITFSCPDTPGIRKLEVSGRRAALEGEYLRRNLRSRKENLATSLGWLRKARPEDRERRVMNTCGAYGEVASWHVKLGEVPQAAEAARAALKTARGVDVSDFEPELLKFIAFEAFRTGDAGELTRAAARFLETARARVERDKSTRYRMTTISFWMSTMAVTAGQDGLARRCLELAGSFLAIDGRSLDKELRRWPNLRAWRAASRAN